jgi:hypothetical protein
MPQLPAHLFRLLSSVFRNPSASIRAALRNLRLNSLPSQVSAIADSRFMSLRSQLVALSSPLIRPHLR